jgi:hypothetical protein
MRLTLTGHAALLAPTNTRSGVVVTRVAGCMRRPNPHSCESYPCVCIASLHSCSLDTHARSLSVALAPIFHRCFTRTRTTRALAFVLIVHALAQHVLSRIRFNHARTWTNGLTAWMWLGFFYGEPSYPRYLCTMSEYPFAPCGVTSSKGSSCVSVYAGLDAATWVTRIPSAPIVRTSSVTLSAVSEPVM